jgi:hypothetical protein
MMEYMVEPEKTDALERIDNAWSTYQALDAARSEIRGAAVEFSDLLAIAHDAVAVALLMHHGSFTSEQARRLKNRLERFPPFAEPRVAAARGVESFLARDDRIKSALSAGANFSGSIPAIIADLRDLASDCEKVARAVPQRIGKPARTKPKLVARNELVAFLGLFPDRYAFARYNQTERAAFVQDMLRALGIEAPKNVLPPTVER